MNGTYSYFPIVLAGVGLAHARSTN